MTRVLVTGAAGLVGSALVKSAPDCHTVAGVTRQHADLVDRPAVLEMFERYRPDVVIHTAYRSTEPELDIVLASANVLDACLAIGAGLVHMSTDVVFGGDRGPYSEQDRPAPVNPYGEAKAAVEADIAERYPEAAVVRTSLVCSTRPVDPRTAMVIDALDDAKPLTLFTDEIRCAVRLDDLVDALWELVSLPARSRAGTWHIVGREAISRYTLGVLIAGWAGLDPRGIVAGTSVDALPARPPDLRLTAKTTQAALSTPMRGVGTLFVPPTNRPRRASH